MRRVSVRAQAYAVHAAIWFVVVATVLAEKMTSFKQGLAGLFGHHWIGKGDLAIVLFFAVVLVFSRSKDPDDVTGLVRGVLLSAVLGALTIFIFYLLHYREMA